MSWTRKLKKLGRRRKPKIHNGIVRGLAGSQGRQGARPHHLDSLDRVKRVVKVLGMVNSAEGFGERPKVVNGFSDLIVEVFLARRRRRSFLLRVATEPSGQAPVCPNGLLFRQGVRLLDHLAPPVRRGFFCRYGLSASRSLASAHSAS
jgi:hypothetical protein